MKVNFFDFQKKLTKLSKEELIAYETGVHLGDGSLVYDRKHRTYRVEYSGDAENDRIFYSEILPSILEIIYSKKPKIYLKKNERTILLVLNSKKVIEQKINLGLPTGNKITLRKIPRFIEKDRKLTLHFLRGLADADFLVTFKKNKKGIHTEPRIEYFTNNSVLANFVHNSLKSIGFRCSLESSLRCKKHTEYRIRIYGKKHLQLWMEKIGFFNPKHLSKILFFEKHGYYIPYLTTEERLELL